MQALLGRGRETLPGLFACLVAAMAAEFLSDHYGAPVMLFALLLGIAFHFLSQEGRCVRGIAVASSSVLRFGVAVLGARISLDDIAALGLAPLIVVLSASLLTIVFGVLAARLMRLKGLGVLTGGAVAICGASAALAIAAVLPRHEQSDRDTIFTVIAVTTLSTIAMVLYPIIAVALGLTNAEAGLFLGATIHDVAQVVGAGYSISANSGDIATFTKLLRVAMLVPVVFALTLLFHTKGEATKRSMPLPLFLIAFVILVGINSAGLIPPALSGLLGKLSSWCLVVAIAALGMKTSFKSLAQVGPKPVLLVIFETIFIAAIVLGMTMSGVLF